MTRPVRRSQVPSWHEGFLLMLPHIRSHARQAFRQMPPEAREEAVQDVVCNAMLAYIRLFEKGKVDLAYPTVLARYGIAQHRCGRRVGTKLNVLDISSPYCRAMKGIQVGRLDRYVEEEQAWKEILIEDKNAGPADIAASRMDFSGWLKTLSKRNRKLALKLAAGESTGIVAKLFKISAGRVSQLRRELMDSWNRFVEPSPGLA